MILNDFVVFYTNIGIQFFLIFESAYSRGVFAWSQGKVRRAMEKPISGDSSKLSLLPCELHPMQSIVLNAFSPIALSFRHTDLLTTLICSKFSIKYFYNQSSVAYVVCNFVKLSKRVAAPPATSKQEILTDDEFETIQIFC